MPTTKGSARSGFSSGCVCPKRGPGKKCLRRGLAATRPLDCGCGGFGGGRGAPPPTRKPTSRQCWQPIWPAYSTSPSEPLPKWSSRALAGSRCDDPGGALLLRGRRFRCSIQSDGRAESAEASAPTNPPRALCEPVSVGNRTAIEGSGPGGAIPFSVVLPAALCDDET